MEEHTLPSHPGCCAWSDQSSDEETGKSHGKDEEQWELLTQLWLALEGDALALPLPALKTMPDSLRISQKCWARVAPSLGFG